MRTAAVSTIVALLALCVLTGLAAAARYAVLLVAGEAGPPAHYAQLFDDHDAVPPESVYALAYEDWFGRRMVPLPYVPADPELAFEWLVPDVRARLNLSDVLPRVRALLDTPLATEAHAVAFTGHPLGLCLVHLPPVVDTRPNLVRHAPQIALSRRTARYHELAHCAARLADHHDNRTEVPAGLNAGVQIATGYQAHMEEAHADVLMALTRLQYDWQLSDLDALSASRSAGLLLDGDLRHWSAPYITRLRSHLETHGFPDPTPRARLALASRIVSEEHFPRSTFEAFRRAAASGVFLHSARRGNLPVATLPSSVRTEIHRTRLDHLAAHLSAQTQGDDDAARR